MKVFRLQSALYRAAALASRLTAETSDIAAVRRDALARWMQARKDGLTAAQAARAVGHSRASLYRWQARLEPRSRKPHRPRRRQWSESLVNAVTRLRDRYPMWGKRKITAMLARFGITTSISTTGRILQHLIARGRITPVPMLRRKPGPRRCRLTHQARHARRLPKGHKPTTPGQLVQIDTLFVNVAPDRPIKHFTAYDPIAKWTTGLVAARATASNAARLLDKLIADAPFPIRGIQVDGGAEFHADFELACRDRNLALFVLPPRRPQLNGAVERSQSTWRYEFYACHELPTQLDRLQLHVDRFAHHFNHQRPHQALGDLTPAEHLARLSPPPPAPSHMT